MSLKTADWTDLLVNALVQLLMAYLSRMGQDATQEVISRVSHSVANNGDGRPLISPTQIKWPLLPTNVERDAASLCVGAACAVARSKPTHLNGVRVRPDPI